MSIIARFAAYAAAFEEAFESSDWLPLADFFNDDAVYSTGLDCFGGGRVEGRDAILAYFERSLDGLDRRFDSRRLTPTEGPEIEGDTLRIVGDATYTSAGVPEFVLRLEERLTFEDGRIARLEDRYTDEMRDALLAYVDAWGEKLGIALPIS